MHNYTSLPNSKKCDQLTCVISVIAENKPAHHETYLHTMKVVTILSPVSTVSASMTMANHLGKTVEKKEKCLRHFKFRVLLC